MPASAYEIILERLPNNGYFLIHRIRDRKEKEREKMSCKIKIHFHASKSSVCPPRVPLCWRVMVSCKFPKSVWIFQIPCYYTHLAHTLSLHLGRPSYPDQIFKLASRGFKSRVFGKKSCLMKEKFTLSEFVRLLRARGIILRATLIRLFNKKYNIFLLIVILIRFVIKYTQNL